MKKKIFILFICLLCLFGITGCKKSQKEVEKYITKINEYAQKNRSLESLHNSVTKADYYVADKTIFNVQAKGVLSNVLYDIDNDGEYEGLNFNFDDNRIDLSILKLENDEIKEIDGLELLNLPKLDDFDLNLFMIKLNKKPYIFIEISGSSSLASDGFYYYLSCFTFEDNKIIEGNNINYQASFYDDNGVKEYITKVKRFGLEMNDIKKSIVSQNKNAVTIFNISRKHLKDFDPEKVKTIQRTQYGEDKITDYFNEKHILELKNVKTKITTENMQYEFQAGNIGSYEWNSPQIGKIVFELSQKNGEYSYIMMFYPNNSSHASEELWGSWDITKTEFNVKHENDTNLAEYKFKNIKYDDKDRIIMDIELVKLNNSDYKDYVIKDGTYTFTK